MPTENIKRKYYISLLCTVAQGASCVWLLISAYMYSIEALN